MLAPTPSAAYLRSMRTELLYLDFDGVLHPADVFRHIHSSEVFLPERLTLRGHRFFEHAELLGSLIEPYSDLRIILSTNWVYAVGYDRARRQLPGSLADRVIGATYHSSMRHSREYARMSRGQQILSDVERRLPHAWLAVDDDEELWPEAHLTNLVLTHPDLGISDPTVRSALSEALARTFSR